MAQGHTARRRIPRAVSLCYCPLIMAILRSVLKRCIDVFGALVGIVLCSGLLLFLALAVRRSLGSPVLFRQTRAGLNGKPIKILKFRTMSDDRDGEGRLLPDAERITRLGRWMRKHSLDELPQLFTVLKGNMSLVGPRPLLTRYLDRYTSRQMRRHEMKPGITGWAQINGRNAVAWEPKLELDVWYVEHFSILLDLRILFRTFFTVVRRDGVLAGAGAELDEFWGTQGVPADGTRAYPVDEDGGTGQQPGAG